MNGIRSSQTILEQFFILRREINLGRYFRYSFWSRLNDRFYYYLFLHYFVQFRGFISFGLSDLPILFRNFWLIYVFGLRMPNNVENWIFEAEIRPHLVPKILFRYLELRIRYYFVTRKNERFAITCASVIDYVFPLCYLLLYYLQRSI